MGFSNNQVEMMKKNWLERSKRKKLEEQKRKAEALKKAEEITRFLKEKYGVKQVILFGSLAWRTKFFPQSDIDLYVAGFPEKASYWKALASAERIASPFPLNLALKENIHPHLAVKIEREGVNL